MRLSKDDIIINLALGTFFGVLNTAVPGLEDTIADEVVGVATAIAITSILTPGGIYEGLSLGDQVSIALTKTYGPEIVKDLAIVAIGYHYIGTTLGNNF